MKIEIEFLEDIEKGEWNKLVKRHQDGTVFQSKQWADYMSEAIGSEPSYIIAKDKRGEVIGLLLLLKESLLHRRIFEGTFSGLAPMFKKIVPTYNWLYGPLVINNDAKIAKQIVESFIEKAKKGRAYMRNVRPPIHGSNVDAFEWTSSLY